MSSEIKLNIDAETVKEEKYKDWEIEDAARTIMRAEEIKQDEELMKLVAPKIKKQAQAAVNAFNAAKVLYGENENKGENNEG